jgi:hypothetical protein
VTAELPKAKFNKSAATWGQIMKQNIAKREILLAEDNRTSDDKNEPHGGGSQSFAHQLRALGQALEKFSFSAFDLELRSGTYLVTGRAVSAENVRFSFPRFVRELLRGAAGRPAVTCTGSQIDLRFSPEEIERFDVCGRIRRQDGGKMPDPYSISQILRGAGSYLDHRDVTSLVGISLKEKWVTVVYQTAEGRLEQAQQDLEYFYDYWVKMYLRRSNRAKLPPPSEPTVFVTWRGIQKVPGISNVPG